jgi:4-hydroxy-tetrahydrodipicolinate reductase
MKLALIGYGVMGRLIESCAAQAGHQVTARLDLREASLEIDAFSKLLGGADVVIDFSIGPAVLRNVSACMQAGLPLVEGATGWNEQLPAVSQLVAECRGSMIYGANFSVGVNLFYRIAANAADLFAGVPSYAPFIEEAHHARKRDAPSGTARKLHDVLAARMTVPIPVSSTRAGYIPGTHRVGFDSAGDQVVLTHTVRSREGFAAGALAAARWIKDRQGLYEFSDVLDDILKCVSQ